MMSIKNLLEKLNLIREEFLDSNHSLLEEAQNISEDSLQCLSDCFVNISNELAKCILKLGQMSDVSDESIESILSSAEKSEDEIIKKEDLEAIASLADTLDSDESTKKIAGVLDKILLSYAFPPGTDDLQKSNFLKKIEMAKQAKLSTPEQLEEKFLKKELTSDNEEIKKIILDKVKSYKPLEFPLQTRSCPDHPGASMTRVEEGVFQCSLDKKLYDYKNGFTLLNGSKVPGGDVSAQSEVPYHNAPKVQSFSK